MIIDNDKAYKREENELFSFYTPVETVEKQPLVSWKKTPIPIELWNKITAICQWTYEEHKSECVIRLYYNETADCWGAEFFDQEMNGMTVSDEFDIKVLVDSKMTPELGWVEAGSVHHHCASGAFQSGTDEKDEFGCPGLHLTIGKLSLEKLEIHARFLSPSGFQDPNIISFFELPTWLNEVPAEYQTDLASKVLSKILRKKGDPKQADKIWKSRVKEKPKVTYYGGRTTAYYHNKSNHTQLEMKDIGNAVIASEEKRKLLDEAEKLYEDYALDQIIHSGHTVDDMIFMINNSRNRMTNKQQKIDWDGIREDIKEMRKDCNICNVTSFLAFLKSNQDSLEASAEIETELTTNDVSETNQIDALGGYDHQYGVV